MYDIKTVLANVNRLSENLEKSPYDSIIIKRVIMDLGSLEQAASLALAKKINNIDLVAWLDVGYSMANLTAFCEAVYLDNNGNDVSLFREVADLSVTNTHIWSTYICYAINFSDFESERFREMLMTQTKLHFQWTYSLVEVIVKEQYKDMVKRASKDNRVFQLYELWGRLKGQFQHQVDTDKDVKDFNNKIEQLLGDYPSDISFQDAIRGVTKKKLNASVRDGQLNSWFFLMHLRNALTHQMKPRENCKMMYGGREFILKKDTRIDYYQDQFVTLSLCTLELYLEFTDFKNNKNFALIKDIFLNSEPALLQ